MLKNIILRYFAICLFVLPAGLFAQYHSSWKQFARAKFKQVNVDELYYADLLVKTPDLSQLDGKAFTITGYYIPVEDPKVIVISRAPMASCFFCGGAGLESIMEIRPINKPKVHFRTDQLLSFKGILNVNDKDYNLLPFILEKAELITNVKN